jgi:mycofactocin system glycosyltransferase
VVIPTLDRSRSLDRCLTALGPDAAAVVIDDGSADPDEVATVCRRHGARLVVRSDNGGPGVARNDGLAAVDSELVAFVDSDCTVTEGWLDPLLPLFDDPAVAAVAPRLRPAPDPDPGPATVCRRYAEARSPLDMGADPSEVGPDRAVRYVPTAALVVRRAAVVDGFDPGLRVGEDVDLVWRLLAEGWRIRYQPSATVHHREPSTWAALLRRRFRYGTSAAPLADRHPGRLAPVELRPWPTLAVGALLAGRSGTALAAVVASGARMATTLGPRGVPPGRSLLWGVSGAGWTLVGLGRAVTMLASPLALVAAGRSRRWAAAVAVLVVSPPMVEWWQRRPALDPLRWTVASVADDMAYGAGVWSGCLATRSLRPLLPTLRLSGGHPDVAPASRSEAMPGPGETV